MAKKSDEIAADISRVANTPQLYKDIEPGEMLGVGSLIDDRTRDSMEMWLRENERIGRMAQPVEYIRRLLMALDNQSSVIATLGGDLIAMEEAQGKSNE
jgi:hypothetical protein